MSCSCHLGLQRLVLTTATANATITGPVSRCRSLFPTSQEPALPTTAKGPVIWDQLCWEGRWSTATDEGPTIQCQEMPLPPLMHATHCHCQRPYHPVPSNAPTSLAACNPLPLLPKFPQPGANFPGGVQPTATTAEGPATRSHQLPGILCKPCTCAPAQPLARQ